MSAEPSPESDKSEKMDISETSDLSESAETTTPPVLRLSLPLTASMTQQDSSTIIKSNCEDYPGFPGSHDEVLDNARQCQYERVNKVSHTIQNATDSHPLMFSPSSPISPDFPDLIPEKPKSRHFKPLANSSAHADVNAKEAPPTYSNSLVPSIAQLDLGDLADLSDRDDDKSDNEIEKSVYEAHLSSNLQNVAMTMNEKEGNLNFLAYGKKSNKLRKIKVLTTEDAIDSDVSSLGSSPDSLKSEDVFAGRSREDDADDFEIDGCHSRNETPEPIEPLSADDERRHARHWQRMVLPGGEQRTIDMRVIEPYKRVLSHGGYLRAGGHTAIVLFSACFLPDKSRCDYDYVMDNLFLYVLWTLERLVTEDYVLVYLHGGATRIPSFRWLKRCYQMVGRKLRKNLSHMYLVHPTMWIKTMLFMAKPFISSKFYRKISFVPCLKDLRGRVPLELAAVPDKVKAYDSLNYGT